MKKIIVLLTAIFIVSAPAQFKYSIGTGIAMAFPDYKEFNQTIQDSGLKELSQFLIPISYNFTYKIYPSLRIGYFRLSNSLATYNRSSDNFNLILTMNGISIQSFFTFWRRLEADFGIAPLYGKFSFYQGDVTATTQPFQFSRTTKAGIEKTFLAYYSWIGLQYHLNSFIALEGSIGFLKSFMKDGPWKNESQKTDLKMLLDITKPVYGFNIIFGW